MPKESEQFEFVVSVADFDVSRLPLAARKPGTDAFQKAVTKAIQHDYEAFGGYVRIRVDPKLIHVLWRTDPDAPNALDVAVGKLKKGDYDTGIALLEVLRRQQPDDPNVLYNLGMALSDVGRLGEAQQHLQELVNHCPDHANGIVAQGVALAREKKYDKAVVVLKRAVEIGPDNPWACRNLGACLMQTNRPEEAVRYLRHAVALNSSDQQALLGLAQALQMVGNEEEADTYYVQVIEMDSRTPYAEVARDARSRFAQESFRTKAVGSIRPDAVMYLLSAIEKFDRMSRDEVQRVAFEVAILGQRGFDTNDSTQKYQLQSMPGLYSGLHLVCLMFVSFRQIAPDQSIGFDLAQEFEAAKQMYQERKNGK